MRGKVCDYREVGQGFRITPAYAGKSAVNSKKKPLCRDHPRLCGEKDRIAKLSYAMKGSPPPMRGKEQYKMTDAQRGRITPAYAGKRTAGSGGLNYEQDHPRLCGEKSGILRANAATTGSPPPMRGKERRSQHLPRLLRITPAYAGKRMSVTESAIWRQDHPRLCGEKITNQRKICTFTGSPPPMRGKGYLRYFFQRFSGITPAYAGKSLRTDFKGILSEDHPRLCGEKSSL